jgi:hypothetical protein
MHFSPTPTQQPVPYIVTIRSVAQKLIVVVLKIKISPKHTSLLSICKLATRFDLKESSSGHTEP